MATKLPVVGERDVVGVVGAGTMGVGIAELAATVGHTVRLYDAIDGAAQDAIQRTAGRLSRRVERGKMSPAERDSVLGRMHAVDLVGGLHGCKLVIEAVVEDLEVKRSLLQSLERVCGVDAILASNTSSLSITSLATGMVVPERLLGMHFFNPAPVMKLVEIVAGLDTAPEVAASMHGLMTRWGKAPVFARSSPGFIVNRVARPFYGEALALLQEGAGSAATLDAIYRDCGGFRMGPFELMDLIGLDVNFAVTRSVYEAFFHEPRYRPSLLQQEMVMAGRLGRKSGRGFYNYQDGALRGEPDVLPLAAPPRRLRMAGEAGQLAGLLRRSAQLGIQVEQVDGPGVLWVDDVPLAQTDGRPAVQRTAQGTDPARVLVDLALNYETAPRVALAAAEGCEQGLLQVAGWFQALGKSVSQVRDLPGMAIMRTVCMLGNEAAQAVAHGVCSPADLDRAMRLGVNYPQGPLAWIQQLGLPRVVQVIRNLHHAYGDDRYRLTSLLDRQALGGRDFVAGET